MAAPKIDENRGSRTKGRYTSRQRDTELFDLVRRAREPRHKRLVLSFDNAAGEAKNSTVLALCDMLVEFDWFRTVEIHQLEPGHTHTYLDALFSHLQAALAQGTIASIADVVDALENAFTSEKFSPSITVLERASDWTAFFAPSLEALAGHSQPLGFKFERVGRNPSAPVRLFVRDNSQSEWFGYRRTATQPIVVLKSLPRGSIKAVPPQEISGSDKDALLHTMAMARNKNLLHIDEAKELQRVVTEGSLAHRPSPRAPSP